LAGAQSDADRQPSPPEWPQGSSPGTSGTSNPLQTPSRRENLFTRSLRVPEEKSRALGQVSRAVSFLFRWHPRSSNPSITPRKLNIPAGGIRHFERASALRLATNRSDDTLGAVINRFVNQGVVLSESPPEKRLSKDNSRRFLAQGTTAGFGPSARVVSVLNVREGQLGTVELELVDKSGHLIGDAGDASLDWEGSVLVGPVGTKVVLGHGLEVGALEQGSVVVSYMVQKVTYLSVRLREVIFFHFITAPLGK
jgi:hypothetical protein